LIHKADLAVAPGEICHWPYYNSYSSFEEEMRPYYGTENAGKYPSLLPWAATRPGWT
jgi:hypothetical protein